MEVSDQLHILVTLPFRKKEPAVPIGWEAGWVPEPVWMWWSREKNCLYFRILKAVLLFHLHTATTSCSAGFNSFLFDQLMA
jgi:hypothetical protein